MNKDLKNRRPYSSTLGALLFRVCTLAMALSVSSCNTADPPDWDHVSVPNVAPLPPAKESITDELIVYLDTSGSMAGYVTSDGQNVFGRTLRAVRDIATSFKQPVRVSVRHVAAAVGAPDPDGALALQKASITDVYKGGDTDLAGAINSFNPVNSQAATHPSPNEQNSSSPISQVSSRQLARFQVLITDGVQSTKGQNTKLGCLKGSDATCVREKIINLIKQGWGGYIIGLRSQFHGNIYPETRGSKFRYDTAEGDWTRYRPFYLYIFSPDPPGLDEFVDALRERLSALVKQDSFRVLALTSRYSSGEPNAEVIVANEAEDFVELVAEQNDNQSHFTLEVHRDKNDTDPAPLTVAVSIPWSKPVQDSGTPLELAKLLSWEVESVYPTDLAKPGETLRYPTVKVANSSVPELDAQGRVPVTLFVGWPRSTAKPSWGVYRLRAKFDLRMEHDPLPWIKLWSTDLDNSTEYANRTLDLETVLGSLWRNPVLEKQTVTAVYLRVGPR